MLSFRGGVWYLHCILVVDPKARGWIEGSIAQAKLGGGQGTKLSVAV